MKDFWKFFFKRLAVIPITLLIVTLVLYGVVMLMPLESRISLYMPNSSNRIEIWGDRMRERIIERHHLNEPFLVQYYYWVRSLFEEEWGYSPVLENTVLSELIRRTPVTVELIIYALLIQIPLGLLSGIYAARKKGRAQDYAIRFISFFASAIPDFILAIILLSIFYISLSWFPPERLSITNHLFVKSEEFRSFTGLLTIDGLLNRRADITLDALRHLVLPVFTLGFAHWAILMRITRSGIIEELGEDYITAAYARGLTEKMVVREHAFRNALGPVLSTSAIAAASLVTGVYVVERIFNLNGVSELVTRYGPMVPDAAAVLGFAVYSTVIVLTLMFILDILQALLIPQIKEQVVNNERV
jgi:ABC-type dipeptide/oligopeptide/nickel transport system permease component